MALILNIDTANESASICLALDGKQVSFSENANQKDHASWLHVAIDEMMKSTGYRMEHLNAIAITEGPGSYTGLRVGMAAAKGLCYVLQIPLITENTLKVMAFAANLQQNNLDVLLCPMIDARRMEVFTALFDKKLQEKIPSLSMILDDKSFSEELETNKIIFFGNGSMKWKQLTVSSNAIFEEVEANSGHLSILSCQKFTARQFTDIIYSQPAYLKDFHSYTRK